MIDWNKPLRTTESKYEVKTAPHPSGDRIIAYWYNNRGEWSEDVFNKFTGAVCYTEFAGKRDKGIVTIENVPEEPKDHLVVYWNHWNHRGEWAIDHRQLMTKARAEYQAYVVNRPFSWRAMKSIVVKVPV